MKLQKLEKLITKWAEDKDLLKGENKFRQLAKVMEELGETSKALLQDDKTEIKDGLGDVFVTLVILARQCGFNLTECANQAWDEIKDRKGKTIDGTFVKKVVSEINYEPFIDRKIKGFAVEGNKIYDDYIGEIGIIKGYDKRYKTLKVVFEDGAILFYPARLCLYHLVEPSV